MAIDNMIRRVIGKDPILGDDIEGILKGFGVYEKGVEELAEIEKKRVEAERREAERVKAEEERLEAERKEEERRTKNSFAIKPTPIVNAKSNHAVLPKNISKPEKYIVLPGRVHRKARKQYSYPDLLVSKYRLGMSPEVEKAAKTLGLTLQNTATEETSGRQYIGRMNWATALSLNLALGSFTLTPRQFVDFLELLKSGRAVDGTGKQISQAELLQIYKEITEVREPYRAEWLDADFKVVGHKLNINYNHEIVSGKLQPKNSESLEDCLMEDSYVDLASGNRHGLPRNKSRTQEIYYYHPRSDNNSVALFSAYSDGASLLFYGRGAIDSDDELGVRRAKILQG